MAERKGFEPLLEDYSKHDFQSCALDQLSHLSVQVAIRRRVGRTPATCVFYHTSQDLSRGFPKNAEKKLTGISYIAVPFSPPAEVRGGSGLPECRSLRLPWCKTSCPEMYFRTFNPRGAERRRIQASAPPSCPCGFVPVCAFSVRERVDSAGCVPPWQEPAMAQ